MKTSYFRASKQPLQTHIVGIPKRTKWQTANKPMTNQRVRLAFVQKNRIDRGKELLVKDDKREKGAD